MNLKNIISATEEQFYKETGIIAKLIPMRTAITPDLILSTVLGVTGVSVSEILSKKRTKPLVNARMVAIYLTKKMNPTLSYSAIGRLYDRDHTTIIYNCKKATDLIEVSDQEMLSILNKINFIYEQI